MPSESATGSSDAAMAAKPQQFGFLLLPQYSMMALSSATEPLRSANYISGKPLYEWHLLTPGTGNTASSSLFEINAQTPLADAPPLDMLFVVASLGVVDYFDEAVFAWLRQFGRADDMIVSGGENIYPREVEEILYRCAGVQEAAVIGMPDPRWGQAVTAFVVRSDPALTAADIDAYCKSHHDLAAYKRPRSVVFVDRLPVNPSGKVLRRELPALAGA